MAVYLLALPGGYIGDRFLAPRHAILLGGLLMAAGQFLLTAHALPFFYGGLTLIAIGTGLLFSPDSASIRGEAGTGDLALPALEC
jgi:POT family proton-dependent oligopeptide transporter